ncbi:glycosyltransferase family 2 protein [Mesorhizobium sp. NPDC059054]|uniref:glycosyltransferase family 2 protein n=1 Tax=Mesorhizobium sp. NPDC059054 TaxID=3346711 RepID=UPI0036B03FA5
MTNSAAISENENLPRVSVMVITYNQADLIEETIASILAEPRYPNLEIVIADDCSTDNSRDVLAALRAKYPNIIKLVLNENNLGITGNSNAAFFETTGDFVAIMGGDDLFLQGKIQAQVAQFLADEKLVLSYHPVEIFEHATGRILAITDQKKRLTKRSVYDVIDKGGIAGASSMMVRRSACPSYGFDERLPVVSDWKFAIDVAFNGRVEKLDGVYGKYRKSGTGASERTYQLLDESLMALSFAQQEHPNDIRLKRACDKGAARYIAGEVYRSLANHPERTTTLADRMLSHRKSPFYVLVWFVARIAARFPFLRNIVTRAAGRTTHFFK